MAQPNPAPAANRSPSEVDDSEPVGIGFDAPPPPMEALVAEGDMQGLLDLGAAHRVGTPYVSKDPAAAHRCFVAAADLGSADASYLVAMACFSGGGVPTDTDEGQRRLRLAAQEGHLRAKIYLANMYELGLYTRADSDKADVWYRAVARGASIGAEPGSPEHVLEMAELGCVRQCLEVVADETMSSKDRLFYLKKAKAMGYAQFLRQTKAGDRRRRAELLEREAEAHVQDGPPTASAERPPIEVAETSGEVVSQRARERDRDERAGVEAGRAPELGAQWTFGAGVAALAVSATFAAAGLGAGWLAMEGARALVAAGRLPTFAGAQPELALYASALVLGAFPAMTVVRWRVALASSIVAALLAVGAFYLYPQLPLLATAPLQAAAAGLAGYVLLVAILGALGGTRFRLTSS